jgi:hypothetical protein
MFFRQGKQHHIQHIFTQRVVHHLDHNLACFINIGILCRDNFNCLDGNRLIAGFDDTALANGLTKRAFCNQPCGLMVEAKTVAAEWITDLAGVTIGFCGGVSTCFGLFYRLYQFPVGDGTVANFIKAAFLLRGLRRRSNRKEHIVATFLDNAGLVQLTAPDQVKNGAILNEVSTVTRYRIPVNIEAITAYIADFDKAAANLGRSFPKRCPRTKRVFKLVCLIIQQIDRFFGAKCLNNFFP